MSTNRRTFLKLSALASGSIGLGLIPGASGLPAAGKTAGTSIGKAAKPLRILILGGTGFTGPFQVRYALSRGHKVTVFNRGKTHPGELPKEAEQLIGDRNGQLDALKGRKWDVMLPKS
jgi:2'-hydroxyisoflavone reductase